MTPFKICVSSAILCMATVCLCHSQPNIVFEKKKHDYGQVRFGERVQATFRFRNAGDRDLRIKKIITSCGCTKALRGRKLIPPGESSLIDVRFDTMGLSKGRKRKKIIVYSNDPDTSIVTLLLFADVIRDIVVEPDSVAKKIDESVNEVVFPLMARNTSDKEVTLRVRNLKGAMATGVLNSGELTLPPDSKRKFKMTITLNKAKDRYFYMGRVFLTSDHPVEKEIPIRYLIEIE